jgi:hypothetical protein
MIADWTAEEGRGRTARCCRTKRACITRPSAHYAAQYSVLRISPLSGPLPGTFTPLDSVVRSIAIANGPARRRRASPLLARAYAPSAAFAFEFLRVNTDKPTMPLISSQAAGGKGTGAISLLTTSVNPNCLKLGSMEICGSTLADQVPEPSVEPPDTTTSTSESVLLVKLKSFVPPKEAGRLPPVPLAQLADAAPVPEHAAKEPPAENA